MILNQRSQDVLAANNWNVCQYAILLMMVAQSVGMQAGQLVHVIADAHIYDRHVYIIRELIARPQHPAPTVTLTPRSRTSTTSRRATSSSRTTSTARRSRTSPSPSSRTPAPRDTPQQPRSHHEHPRHPLPNLHAIVAVCDDWGIGSAGDMVVENRADMRHFVAKTSGHTVLMGRRTLGASRAAAPSRTAATSW